MRDLHLRPGHRRKALQDILSEVLGGEVAVFEQCTCLDLDVADGTEFFDQSTERMKGADRL